MNNWNEENEEKLRAEFERALREFLAWGSRPTELRTAAALEELRASMRLADAALANAARRRRCRRYPERPIGEVVRAAGGTAL